MNHSILLPALVAAVSLSACEKPAPVVVNVPVPVAVPGPAGPQGATGDKGAQGNQGNQGNAGDAGLKGEAGKPGAGTTVVVIPPAASAPTN
jgi:hypothetical protein